MPRHGASWVVAVLATLVAISGCGDDSSVATRPIVLIFHPGAFKYGSAALMTAEEEAARQQGLKPVSVEYLGRRQVGLPYSKRLSRRYARHGNAVVAFGESAGASLAGVLAKRGLVKAAAVYDPPTDLMHQRWSGFLPDPLRRRLSLDAGPTASPILAIASLSDQVVGWRDTVRWARTDPAVKLATEPGAHLDPRDIADALRRSMRYLARQVPPTKGPSRDYAMGSGP
jgi:hypothetical protein